MPTLWFPGNMTVQFLLFFTLIFLGGIPLQRTLARQELRVTALWQAVVSWDACDVVLKFVVFFRFLRRVGLYVPQLGHNHDVRDKNRPAPFNFGLILSKPAKVSSRHAR